MTPCTDNNVCSIGDQCTAGVCISGSLDPTCVPVLCGNGNLDLGEECDDGNQNNGDACSNTCLLTSGGQVGVVLNLQAFCGGNAASVNPPIIDQDTPPNLELSPRVQVSVSSTGTGAASVTASATDYLNVNGIIRMLADVLHFSSSTTIDYALMTPMSGPLDVPVVFIENHLPGTTVTRDLQTLVNYNNAVTNPPGNPPGSTPVLEPVTMVVDLVFVCPNSCTGTNPAGVPNQIVANGVCVDCPPGSVADPAGTNTCR